MENSNKRPPISYFAAYDSSKFDTPIYFKVICEDEDNLRPLYIRCTKEEYDKFDMNVYIPTAKELFSVKTSIK